MISRDMLQAMAVQFNVPNVTHVEIHGGGSSLSPTVITRAEFEAAQAAVPSVSDVPADGDRWVRLSDYMTMLRAFQRENAAGRLAHGDVIGLIERIVTGDGQQLENLTITDDEWRALALDEARRTKGCAEGEVNITLPIENWIALVRIARNYRLQRIDLPLLISETVRSEDFNRTIAASHALVTAPLPDLSPWASRCLIRNPDQSPTACGLKSGHGGERHDFTVNVPEMD